MEKVFSGGCLCGAVRFTAANGGNVHTCSCDICQKHTGAQTVVWIEFPAENVQDRSGWASGDMAIVGLLQSGVLPHLRQFYRRD